MGPSQGQIQGNPVPLTPLMSWSNAVHVFVWVFCTQSNTIDLLRWYETLCNISKDQRISKSNHILVLKVSKSVTFASKMHFWNLTDEIKSKTNGRLNPATHRLQAYPLTDRAMGVESSQFKTTGINKESIKQEAHGPHRSPEKTVQIIKNIWLYHKVD